METETVEEFKPGEITSFLFSKRKEKEKEKEKEKKEKEKDKQKDKQNGVKKKIKSKKNKNKKKEEEEEEKDSESVEADPQLAALFEGLEKSEPITNPTLSEVLKKRQEQLEQDKKKKEEEKEREGEEEEEEDEEDDDEESKIAKEFRELFVGNLVVQDGVKRLQKDLKEKFKKYGKIECLRLRSVIVKEKAPARKLHMILEKAEMVNAYIRFEEVASVKAALKENNSLFNGKHLVVNAVASRGISHRNTVFVGNLPFDVTDEEIRDHFLECGTVEKVRIPRVNGQGRGISFVTFGDADSFNFALEMNGTYLRDRQLNVSKSSRQRNKPNPKKVKGRDGKSEQPNKSLKRKREQKGNTEKTTQQQDQSKKSFQGRKASELTPKQLKKLQRTLKQKKPPTKGVKKPKNKKQKMK